MCVDGRRDVRNRRNASIRDGVSILPENGARGFNDLAAVEASDASGFPDEYSVYEVRAMHCAVFDHSDHVSEFGKVIRTIVHKSFPASGYGPKTGQWRFDLHRAARGGDFDPMSGAGHMEIWFPIESKTS